MSVTALTASHAAYLGRSDQGRGFLLASDVPIEVITADVNDELIAMGERSITARSVRRYVKGERQPRGPQAVAVGRVIARLAAAVTGSMTDDRDGVA